MKRLFIVLLSLCVIFVAGVTDVAAKRFSEAEAHFAEAARLEPAPRHSGLWPPDCGLWTADCGLFPRAMG